MNKQGVSQISGHKKRCTTFRLRLMKNGHGLFYSGVEKHTYMGTNWSSLEQIWESVSERIMSVVYKVNESKVATVLMVYRPNKTNRKTDKEDFWACLQT